MTQKLNQCLLTTYSISIIIVENSKIKIIAKTKLYLHHNIDENSERVHFSYGRWYNIALSQWCSMGMANFKSSSFFFTFKTIYFKMYEFIYLHTLRWNDDNIKIAYLYIYIT